MMRSCDSSTFDHPPKRSRTKAPPPKSNSNIDDLPDHVLVDILSRLPLHDCGYLRYTVCMRWMNLMSTSYFGGLYLLRNKLPPQPLTLVNKRGESFPLKLTPHYRPKLVSRLFERLTRVMSLTSEPVVVGASSDLILCCATESFQRDYYICNPYTSKWCNLPPPSRVLCHVPVGFVCEPYYSYIKNDEVNNVRRRRGGSMTFDDGNENELVNINVSYRCMVVRILPYDDTSGDERLCSKFKLNTFSFEAHEWKESIISFPRRFSFHRINSEFHFSHKGMLYWSSSWGSSNFLIGLDPFMINDTDNCSSNLGRYIELKVKNPEDDLIKINPDELELNRYQISCLGVGGCLRMCVFDSLHKTILCWEWKEEKDLVIAVDSCLYSL